MISKQWPTIIKFKWILPSHPCEYFNDVKYHTVNVLHAWISFTSLSTLQLIIRLVSLKPADTKRLSAGYFCFGRISSDKHGHAV